MYFELFKPQNWRKRSIEARRHNCALMPQPKGKESDYVFIRLCLGKGSQLY